MKYIVNGMDDKSRVADIDYVVRTIKIPRHTHYSASSRRSIKTFFWTIINNKLRDFLAQLKNVSIQTQKRRSSVDTNFHRVKLCVCC
jgi:hypothetical protein